MSIRSLLLTAVALLLSNAAQSILAIYYTNAPLSLWGLLVFIVTGLAALNVLLAVFLAWYYQDLRVFFISDEPEQRSLLRRHRGRLTLAQTMVLVSAMNSFAAVTQWYGTPPDRTPPLVQSIANALITVAAAPASQWLLGDRKRYCSWEPALGVALVVASVVVSILPTALRGGTQFDSGAGVWSVYYTLSTIPQAVAITGGQYFQIRSGALEPGATDRDRRFTIGRMLLYNQAYVLAFLAAFFWVDLLPWFGSSASLSQFASGAAFSFQCSLLGPSGVDPSVGDPSTCPRLTPLYAGGFLAAYIVLLVCQAVLSRDSAVFNTMILLFSTAFISLFWLLPGVNPDAADTPAWSVLSSLVLSLGGVVVWKRWEMRTPSSAQFSVVSLAQELAEEEVGQWLQTEKGRDDREAAGEGDLGGAEDALKASLLYADSAVLLPVPRGYG